MQELTLTLSDELYIQLQTKAMSKGVPVERFIVEQLAIGVTLAKKPEEEKHFLHEALTATGLLQPISSELVATYVPDPSAPRRSPVPMQGKPLSDVIIEQRTGRE
jgi:methanogenic corrinoid protein MtbC1